MRLATARLLLGLAVLAALVLLSTCTHAQTLGLHTATWHSRPGYQAATPGAYLRWDNGATLGAYRNSEGHGTAYAGWTWTTDEAAPLSVGFTAAAATGYAIAPVVPLLAPSAAWRATPGTTLRLVALPKWHPKQGATAVSLSVEVRL